MARLASDYRTQLSKDRKAQSAARELVRPVIRTLRAEYDQVRITAYLVSQKKGKDGWDLKLRLRHKDHLEEISWTESTDTFPSDRLIATLVLLNG